MQDTLQKGDIVLNGYQDEPYDMYLIVGSTSRKTGTYSRTKYYRTQHVSGGELLEGEALFSKSDNRLNRIGHINIGEVMKDAILAALKAKGGDK